jgi:hypothetical protein
MSDYSANLCKKFQEELGRDLRKVSTPYLTDAEWSQDCEDTGKFSDSCSSHVASALFLARVGRPDLSTPVQRLCTKVSRWTTVEDSALVRMVSYLWWHTDLVLVGSLGPADREDVVLRLYTDADWSGDGASTKSTSGCWLELWSPTSGRTWPICWSTTKQTATASSTCEAELVALSGGLRKEALPAQILIESILGSRLSVACNVDNTQAISAAQKGYSNKLRCLSRTQRVSIGVIHEVIQAPEMCVTVEYCSTVDMKGDMFTKALTTQPFQKQREAIGIVPFCCS